MIEPTKPTVRHDDDGQAIISGVTLVLTGSLHVLPTRAPRFAQGADALTTLANGETGAALGAALSSLLDLLAAGQPQAAAEALGISGELVRRMMATRAELRAGL